MRSRAERKAERQELLAIAAELDVQRADPHYHAILAYNGMCGVCHELEKIGESGLLMAAHELRVRISQLPLYQDVSDGE